MSEANESLPIPAGLTVVEPEAAPSASPAMEIPEADTFPQAILSGTSGKGIVIGAAVALQRVSDKNDPDYGKRKQGAQPRLDVYCAPTMDGSAVASPGNRFGVRSADQLPLTLVETILENAEDVRAPVDWAREHGVAS